MQSPLSGLLMGASLLPMAAFLMPSAAMAQTTQGAPENAKPTAPEIIVTGRFIASGAASATKQNVSTLETPFSVSAYTGDFMKAVQTTQVADLYRYMTGLQKAGSTGYDITLRGFSTTANDRNTVMVDGLPGLSVRFGSPPTVGTEHVEVVKGAASLLYGSVQPGGFVNMITKKTLGHRLHRNFGARHGGRFLARLAGAGRRFGHRQHRCADRRWRLALSLCGAGQHRQLLPRPPV